ncbi:hypothetical protein PsorP6_009564 [Peronosclerospora sorghi]|uniref:Uncharacterized protein n=1 Tax=Peronosclerospora sorghi TaxID=230839 RepID=A0ACC0VZX4_9STRA|nr:hypothetical protein PsorP6_009564 [Peronosclerospora sorghi]
MEAYVLVEKPHAIEKVFVFGRAAMNRGVHEDYVAVKMLPKTQWRAPQSNLLLLHYVQDETYHDQQSRSIEQETDNEDLEGIPTGQVVGILRRSTSTYPNGHYVGILGASGNLQTELISLLVDNEVEEAPFSDAALACLPSSDDCPIGIEGDCVAECSKAKRPAQCGLLNWKIPDEEIVQRRDLRTTHRVFSVDPQDCQDIDDAMPIQRLSNGNIELGVHIADVYYFVKHGSALDMEARRRGTTVYLVGQRLDMLPSVLSADLCSLHQNRDRFAVSVMWELDGETFNVVDNST